MTFQKDDAYFHDLTFNDPETKDSYYLLKPSKKIYCNLIDTKILNIVKMKNNGYLMHICLDSESRHLLKDIDNVSIIQLLSNNEKWFNNELSEDDIKQMFYSSFCEQNNTIKLYMRNNSNIFINNKPLELNEFLDLIDKNTSYFKQNMFNIKIQYMGMYVYKTQTINKWCINTFNIYENTEDMNVESKEDIEEFWKNMVDKCDIILDKKIQNIETSKSNIRSIYNEMIQTNNMSEWENHIEHLKKIVQNIIF